MNSSNRIIQSNILNFGSIARSFRVYDISMIDDRSSMYESNEHKNNSSYKLEQMFNATWRFQLQ